MLVHLCDVVLESVHNGEHALAWAMSQVVEVGNAEMFVKSASRDWTALNRIHAELQVALVSLGRDEALTVIRSSFKGQEMDFWRRH